MNTCTIITDDTLMEMTSHDDSRYPLSYYLDDVWQYDFHCIDWHWHYEVEFLSVTEGTVRCLVGTDQIELSKGQGMFINSGILHRFEASERTVIPNIIFSPVLLASENSLIYEKYIETVIKSDIPYRIFSPEVGWQEQIMRILTEIYTLQEAKERRELATMQLLFGLWELLFMHLDLKAEALGLAGFNHKQARLQIMMQFIHDHYREGITLEEIAAAASVSKSSAIHDFQSGIQIPPVAYLIRYRLMQAAGLLGTTEKSVSDIAAETGFESAGYFCRKFKRRYQMSPLEYRRKAKGVTQEPVGIPKAGKEA